jgi:hypothetical protein
VLEQHAGIGKRRMQIYRWAKKLDIDLDRFRK